MQSEIQSNAIEVKHILMMISV